MEFIKLILSTRGNYNYLDSSNIAMNILGNYLSCDVRCGNSYYRAWALADKEDPNSKFSHSIGGNITQLEEENNIISIREIFSEEKVPTEVQMTKEQFVQLLDEWEEKVCKLHPKEVVIKYEKDQYSIETYEGVFNDYIILEECREHPDLIDDDEEDSESSNENILDMQSPLNLSETFKYTIISTHGDEGVQWLERLPELIAKVADYWDLTDLQVLPQLTYNVVLSGMMKGEAIVLKLYCTMDNFLQELMALTVFRNHGCVNCIVGSSYYQAMVLERIFPGDQLTSLFPDDDQRAICIALNVMQQLHTAPIRKDNRNERIVLTQILPDLHKDIPALLPFLPTARELRVRLLALSCHEVYLHGDFHYGNILAAPNNHWVAIDPEGLIGNPLYDVALLIRHPLKQIVNHPHAQQIIDKRIRTCAKVLKCNTQDIYEWTYLQAVTSAYWSVEDGLDIVNHTKFLKLLQQVKI